ncbi:MAG: c-type cytochrome [Candidatus Acidulodesulfobacterium ferriphilum]|jgi:Cytochrome c.|uniref:C-type cytochrome n=1 Tax=Candidatus Acidulodesulfobacterium ferriphilum TaxID=2597223 RepID=A0A519BDW4_9DELT|nr:MAG: c-type cytochrome [Candidatus Acidulodesulfobacterium ferriphilum]
MIMPKNNKNIIKIGIFVSLGLILILAVPVLALLVFMKTSNGSNLKNLKTKNGRAIFYNLGCVKCHNIRALNIKGGHVGPDLSGAYSNVEKVYRKSLNDFLKNPAGTMYFILMFNHLSKENRKIIIAELKKAQTIENKNKK